MADKRKNNSRPKLDPKERKSPVAIGIKEGEIEEYGGRALIRILFRNTFEEKLKKKREWVKNKNT